MNRSKTLNNTLLAVPFVLSGPSGVGKTTVRQHILKLMPGLRYSVSATTRAPRPGETHGRDYYFISAAQFEDEVKAGHFLEWAEVHGNLYGTPKSPVERDLHEGLDVLLEIDVAGAKQVRTNLSGVVSIFLWPPSVEELVKRLHKRGLDTEDDYQRRLANAKSEMVCVEHYDYVVVNEGVEETVKQVQAIIMAERCRTARALARWRADNADDGTEA